MVYCSHIEEPFFCRRGFQPRCRVLHRVYKTLLQVAKLTSMVRHFAHPKVGAVCNRTYRGASHGRSVCNRTYRGHPRVGAVCNRTYRGHPRVGAVCNRTYRGHPRVGCGLQPHLPRASHGRCGLQPHLPRCKANYGIYYKKQERNFRYGDTSL